MDHGSVRTWVMRNLPRSAGVPSSGRLGMTRSERSLRIADHARTPSRRWSEVDSPFARFPGLVDPAGRGSEVGAA